MKAFRVTHQSSGDSYFLLADSPRHAVEIVTLRFQSPEGIAAWTAASAEDAPTLSPGVVLDEAGKPVTGVGT